MDKVFESIIHVCPVISEMLGGKAVITIWDKEECLYSLDSKDKKSAVKVGQNVDKEFNEKSGVTDVIFKQKRTLTTILNTAEHGLDSKVTLIPVMSENGEVAGFISISYDMSHIMKVKNSTKELKSSLEETNSTISGITDSAVQLSEKLNFMVENTKETEKLIDESSKAVTLIENISKQSNLLGLNAAIESSRAGEFGKGFSVVASEMRKLALDSGQSSKRISAALAEMSNSMKSIIDTINELGEIATNQAASLEEVSASVEEITSNSQVLAENINMN